MNKVFTSTSFFYTNWWHFYMGRMLSTGEHAQKLMYDDLLKREALRRKRFQWEIKEFETSDPLDKALIRAAAKKEVGLIDAPTYHAINDRISSLKKLKFTDEYEKWKDREIYEWMKYKVAAEVGGEEERAAFELFEKTKLDEKGEMQFRLWRQRIEKDPAAQRFIAYF